MKWAVPAERALSWKYGSLWKGRCLLQSPSWAPSYPLNQTVQTTCRLQDRNPPSEGLRWRRVHRKSCSPTLLSPRRHGYLWERKKESLCRSKLITGWCSQNPACYLKRIHVKSLRQRMWNSVWVIPLHWRQKYSVLVTAFLWPLNHFVFLSIP